MPVYEYECPAHGKFEISQRISAPAIDTCPTVDGDADLPEEQTVCGKPVQRLISANNFALKGKGWAKDGYR